GAPYELYRRSLHDALPILSSLYAKYVRDRPAYLSNASTTYPALAGGAGRSARTSRQQVAVPNTRNRPFTREISEQTGWILLLVTFRTHSRWSTIISAMATYLAGMAAVMVPCR